MCEGRVAVVTGAGRGIGREYALMLAEQGAKVVVNDLGGDRDGTGADASPAQQVVDEITAMGGEAAVNGADVSDFAAAKAMIDQAVETFGGLDVVVNNAGILRDRMLTNMTEEEWDLVIKVHLKGTFAPARHAAAYWRERSKAGETNDARIINTTSVSGIYGNVGQTNYGAAKQGIAGFTFIAALELERYGVTVNAIAPGALTRLTEDLGMGRAQRGGKGGHVAPVDRTAVHLARQPAVGRGHRAGVRGSGRMLAVAEGWHRGPTAPAVDDPAAVDAVVRELLGSSPRAGRAWTARTSPDGTTGET